MKALNLSTGRVTAIALASALLLAAYASTPAAAHDREAVDKRRMAQAAADEQKRELEEMRLVNVDARQIAQQLQRRIRGLQAEVIDSGLLLTLDDVLFAGNSAQLNADGSERLDKLASFLDDHPYRVAQIESSAACKASAGYDATLSERRSVAVASYLVQRGIASARLSARASGRTEQASSSVAYDCDAQSLYQNRRVLVTIENVLTSAGQP